MQRKDSEANTSSGTKLNYKKNEIFSGFFCPSICLIYGKIWSNHFIFSPHWLPVAWKMKFLKVTCVSFFDPARHCTRSITGLCLSFLTTSLENNVQYLQFRVEKTETQRGFKATLQLSGHSQSIWHQTLSKHILLAFQVLCRIYIKNAWRKLDRQIDR